MYLAARSREAYVQLGLTQADADGEINIMLSVGTLTTCIKLVWVQ